MGDGGAGNGGGIGFDTETGALDLYGIEQSTEGMNVAGQTQTESAFGYGVPGSESAIQGLSTEVANIETGLAGDTGAAQAKAGGGVAETPTPRAWEAGIGKASETAAKTSEKAAITRKRRRRTLLTQEEGGIMGPVPTYRRSILGR